MAVNYKLANSVYNEILQKKSLKDTKENEVSIIFYPDRIVVNELDVKLELDRRDIKSIIEEEHTVIETNLGYNIIILAGVIKNKESMLEYLYEYINTKREIDKESVRIDTINKISTVIMNNSKIEFNLNGVEKITEDDENLYFLNKTILFEKIILPKYIFDDEEDKNRFLESLEFNKIKINRVIKRLFLE
ncbi:MAG: hypothetical protein ACRCWM_00795 [Sarcina sp.]